MAINKFQRSRLTFQLRSLVLESHQYIKTVFSHTIGPIKLKFHVKTPYDKLAKIYATLRGLSKKFVEFLHNFFICCTTAFRLSHALLWSNINV